MEFRSLFDGTPQPTGTSLQQIWKVIPRQFLQHRAIVSGSYRGLGVCNNFVNYSNLSIPRRCLAGKEIRFPGLENQICQCFTHVSLVSFYGKISQRMSWCSFFSLSLSLAPSYVQTGASVIKMVLRNFAPVIKSNMAAPPVSIGVDVVREERWV